MVSGIYRAKNQGSIFEEWLKIALGLHNNPKKNDPMYILA
jgi:hypothetical protein